MRYKLRNMSVAFDTVSAPAPSFPFLVNFDIGSWWEQAYPIIEQVATVTGAITGVATITTAPLVFIKWMRSKLQERKNKDEYTWVKLILAKEEWTISSLAEKLDLSEDDARKILKSYETSTYAREFYNETNLLLRFSKKSLQMSYSYCILGL